MFVFRCVTHGGDGKRNENVFVVKSFCNYFCVDFMRAVCEYLIRHDLTQKMPFLRGDVG